MKIGKKIMNLLHSTNTQNSEIDNTFPNFKAEEVLIYIGKKLKFERLLMGKTILQVSNEIKITSQTICKYEKGTSVMDIVRLLILAQYYNKPIEYFIGPFNLKSNSEGL